MTVIIKKIILSNLLIFILFSGNEIKAHNSFLKIKVQTMVPKLKQLMYYPVVIETLKVENSTNQALSNADIQKLDRIWQKENSAISKNNLINKIINNKLSQYLREIKIKSKGLYSEIFVMDSRGLIIGMTSKTSDYCQSDEKKWLKTFKISSKDPFIDELKFDESSQTFQIQVSFLIQDHKSKQNLGAATFGIKADNIEKKIKKRK